MTEVTLFTGITKLDISPDAVLQAAIGKLDQVVVAGFDKDGNDYFASSVADGGNTLWHLARAQYRLMQVADELEKGEL